MLQSVLQSLIPVMQNAVMAVIPLAMLLAIMQRDRQETLKQWVWRGIIWGLIGAAFIATMKFGSRAIKREVYEGLVLVAGFSAEAVLIGFLGWNYLQKPPDTRPKLLGILAFVVAATLLLYHGLELILFPLNIMLAANSIAGFDILLKVIGIILAIIVTGLTGLAVIRAAAALSPKALWIVFTVQFLTVMLNQGVLIVQIMMLRKLVPISRELMAVMSTLINHRAWFLYLLLAMTVVLPVALLLEKRPARPAGSNPAQYRKIIMAAKRNRRWGAAVATSLLVVFLCSSVGTIYAEQKAEIVPAVPVTASQGAVGITLDKVEDGHLHRFVYKTSSGSNVRFIIIKKSGSAYGIGLDACEICGPTGYYERDGQVVCKLCDVVMNTATIGFKGGCNPIPLQYKIAEGKIIIPAEALEQEKDRFK